MHADDDIIYCFDNLKMGLFTTTEIRGPQIAWILDLETAASRRLANGPVKKITARLDPDLSASEYGRHSRRAISLVLE